MVANEDSTDDEDFGEYSSRSNSLRGRPSRRFPNYPKVTGQLSPYGRPSKAQENITRLDTIGFYVFCFLFLLVVIGFVVCWLRMVRDALEQFDAVKCNYYEDMCRGGGIFYEQQNL